MKQLLNNPWVVGTLCVLALITVYFRLFDSKTKVEPPVNTVQAQATSNVAAVLLSPSSLQTAEAAPSPDLLQTQSIDVGWPKELGRDPFQPIQTIKLLGDQEFERNEEEDNDTGRQATKGVMRLHAVFLDGPTRIAMINRQLVKEGEQFEGYVVDQIQRERVRLKSEEDIRVLEFPSSLKEQSSES